MASVKFVGVSCSLSGIIDYITNREKTTDRLITGVNCVAQSALHEFETVNRLKGVTRSKIVLPDVKAQF